MLACQEKQGSVVEAMSFEEVSQFAEDTWTELSDRKVITLIGHDVDLEFKVLNSSPEEKE